MEETAERLVWQLLLVVTFEVLVRMVVVELSDVLSWWMKLYVELPQFAVLVKQLWLDTP